MYKLVGSLLLSVVETITVMVMYVVVSILLKLDVGIGGNNIIPLPSLL